MPNIAATLSLNVPAITALCKGEAGNTILNGTVDPSGLVGNEGDFFLNVATAQLFGPKTGGLWPPGVVLNNSALAPDWNSVYSSVRASSGSWDSAYTTSRTSSADWNNVYTTTRNNSANWNNTYTTVRSNSAVFTNVQNASANRDNVYTTVRTNSANWTNYDLGVRALTSNWQSTYTTVFNNSGSWTGGGGGAGVDLGVRALTSFWDSTYTTVRTTSSSWSSVYTSVGSNSSNWNAVYSTVYNNSGGWEAGAGVASIVNTNSPYWDWAFTVSQVVTADRVQFTASSGNWDWAYSNALTGEPDNWSWAYNNALTGRPDDWNLAYDATYSLVVSGPAPNGSEIALGDTYSINGGRAFVMRSGGFNGIVYGVNVTAVAPVTATIPSQATSANNWRNGTSIRIAQIGTAKVQVSAAPGSGITIYSTGNQFRTSGQGAVTELIKITDSAWAFTGDISTV